MKEPQVLYLSRAEIASLEVTMKEIIDVLFVAFREHGERRVEMPPKPGVHTRPDAFLHAMPAYLPALGSVGMKWVGGYPGNFRRGLPTITGLIVLNDEETGLPLAVMDCTWITAMRTGAATAVAARHLARPESESLGILGCGVQARSHLEALAALFPIRRVVAYDTLPEQAARFAQFARDRFGLEAEIAEDPRRAVEALDLVVTAGPILRKPHATIKAGWLSEGAFASLVDFDSYWEGAAMREVAKFCTDDVAQLEHYRRAGYFQDLPPIHATVGELVAGRKPGRENPREKTMTCNLGLALEDVATAPLVYRRALERKIGTWLPL